MVLSTTAVSTVVISFRISPATKRAFADFAKSYAYRSPAELYALVLAEFVRYPEYVRGHMSGNTVNCSCRVLPDVAERIRVECSRQGFTYRRKTISEWAGLVLIQWLDRQIKIDARAQEREPSYFDWAKRQATEHRELVRRFYA